MHINARLKCVHGSCKYVYMHVCVYVCVCMYMCIGMCECAFRLISPTTRLSSTDCISVKRYNVSESPGTLSINYVQFIVATGTPLVESNVSN